MDMDRPSPYALRGTGAAFGPPIAPTTETGQYTMMGILVILRAKANY